VISGARERAVVRRTALALVCASVPFATSGCLSSTDITLDITSDLPCSKLDEATITAGLLGTVENRGSDAVARKCSDKSGGGSLGTLVLTPRGDPNDEIIVRVVAGVASTKATTCTEANDYEGCIVARRELHYELHKPLELPIELHASCLETRCIGEDSTCVDGHCFSSKIADPSKCVGDGCSQAKLFAGASPSGCLGDVDFAGVGTLAGTHNSSFSALSADGTSVFGFSSSVRANGLPDANTAEAFQCRTPNERSPVLAPLGRHFQVHGSDGSGSVIVGTDFPDKTSALGVRSTAGHAVELKSSNGFSSSAFGCDRDSCSVIVGEVESFTAFWSSPTADSVLLPPPAGGNPGGTAFGVDPTGHFAFGQVSNGPAVWDLAGRHFRALDAATAIGSAYAATPGGDVIVGEAFGTNENWQATLWKADKPWTSYTATALAAPIKGEDCFAVSVTDDGSRVGGWCGPSATSVAMLWEASAGFAPTPASERIAVPQHWQLLTVYLSADGSIVAGDAINPQRLLEVYVARLK
jgi:hypothetical protein